jgi:DNA polymerase III subunit epsilon
VVLSAPTVVHDRTQAGRTPTSGDGRAGCARGSLSLSHPRSTVTTMADHAEERSGFAVVDVETTGFSPDHERIVEVGVVTLDPGGDEVGAFCTLIDPRRDPGPTHVHGISADMLAGAPTFGAVHAYLADQLSGRVVVGHNIDRFDLAFIRAECFRCGGAGSVPKEVPSIDTLGVAQRHLGLRGRASLVDCCTRFGLAWDDHHSALGDARVTAALFRSMRAWLGDHSLGITDLLEAARVAEWPGASRRPPSMRDRGARPTPVERDPLCDAPAAWAPARTDRTRRPHTARVHPLALASSNSYPVGGEGSPLRPEQRTADPLTGALNG